MPNSSQDGRESVLVPNVNPSFVAALEGFKQATQQLEAEWDDVPADIFGDTYPPIPSFDEFSMSVSGMEIQQRNVVLPALPSVGTIVRAREALNPLGSFVWHKGWTGEIRYIGLDYVKVECHRYLGPGAHEWENCRQLSLDDGRDQFEHRYGYEAPDGLERETLLACALDAEFEVV